MGARFPAQGSGPLMEQEEARLELLCASCVRPPSRTPAPAPSLPAQRPWPSVFPGQGSHSGVQPGSLGRNDDTLPCSGMFQRFLPLPSASCVSATLPFPRPQTQAQGTDLASRGYAASALRAHAALP